MKPAIKAELRKLITLRSTYAWMILSLVLVGIYAVYGEGFSAASNLLKTNAPENGAKLFVASTITQMSGFIAIFGAIIALLSITQEYRHNTITYTLTASNSRTKVLASKILTIMGFVFFYSLIMTVLGLAMVYMGLALSHNVLPHQDINYLTYLGKSVFYAEAYALVALLIGILIRNQVGAFAAVFIIPGPIEALLGLLLKKNSVYLPFRAMQEVIQPPFVGGANPPNLNASGYFTPAKGAAVFLIYILTGWLVAWYLFLRRDAA